MSGRDYVMIGKTDDEILMQRCLDGIPRMGLRMAKRLLPRDTKNELYGPILHHIAALKACGGRVRDLGMAHA